MFSYDEFLFAINQRGKMQMSVTEDRYGEMKYIGYREQVTDYLIIENPEKVPFSNFVNNNKGGILKSFFDIRKEEMILTICRIGLSNRISPYLYGKNHAGACFFYLSKKETLEKLYELKDNFNQNNIKIFDFKAISEVCESLRDTKKKLLGLPTIVGDVNIHMPTGKQYALIKILDAERFTKESLWSYFKDNVEHISIFSSGLCEIIVRPKYTITLIELLDNMGEYIKNYCSICGIEQGEIV